MKSLLIKFYLSSRRDAFVFLLAPIVRNFAMFSLKNVPFLLKELDYCFSLFHYEQEMLQVLCQVINYPP